MKMVGPTFGGGFGGPPRMEGERGNLEGQTIPNRKTSII
jgi:hypothetical protein